MPTEVLEWLQPKPGAWYLDATFGAGGHTRKLLEAGARVVALDFDQTAIDQGGVQFASEINQGQLILIRANFANLNQAPQLRETQFSGALFDLGTSSDQLTSTERGLSFSGDGPLDMRLDTRLGVTAADLLAALSHPQLSQLFIEYGGEQPMIAKKVATKILAARAQQPLVRTAQLVELINSVKPHKSGQLHPATKIFQALRIAVNTEIDNLAQALPQVERLLQPGARLVVISFHDGEDRVVKHWMQQAEAHQQGQRLFKKPLTPSQAELQQNPRSRSAKLRVFEKR